MNPGAAWIDMSSHRQWLDASLATLISRSLPSIRADGGFYWLDADGTPMPGREPQLYLTARMSYVAALASLRGVPGSGELLDAGLASLSGLHADPTYGGWLSQPGAVTRKSTYDHVHVGLAAATAASAGHPDADALLTQVIEVIDTHLWDADAGAFLESFAPDWSGSEDYRGANANMHGLEALLAIGYARDDPQWHARGLRIADRIINGAARDAGWLIPEHYDTQWRVDPEYNRDKPNDPFRPFGATLGHSLEWARFLLDLDRSPLVESPSWLAESAEGLARRALDGGWGLDGLPGLVYTIDWDGQPVSALHLHWPVCEGISATAALSRTTSHPHWDDWYRRLWDHAARYFIDDRGTWRNELDAELREAGSVWPGRPDVYHSAGAYLTPLNW